jgi:hypothetical protein
MKSEVFQWEQTFRDQACGVELGKMSHLLCGLSEKLENLFFFVVVLDNYISVINANITYPGHYLLNGTLMFANFRLSKLIFIINICYVTSIFALFPS